jgi:hypothetical protein
MKLALVILCLFANACAQTDTVVENDDKVEYVCADGEHILWQCASREECIKHCFGWILIK